METESNSSVHEDVAMNQSNDNKEKSGETEKSNDEALVKHSSDSKVVNLGQPEFPVSNGVNGSNMEVKINGESEERCNTALMYPQNVQELTSYCAKSNRDVNCFISSRIPDICKKQPCILGIDEAGRGPVLGPMVYGVCFCPKSKEDDLKETGCADSKSLTEEKRETIFDEICKHGEYIGWEVEVISPSVISTSMLRRQKVSLNEVSHNAAIGLLSRALDAGVQVSEVFVDTVGPAEKYQAKLKNLFPELSITVAKKADSTYPIVGGASICAKVTRDVAIKSWTFTKIESSGDAWGSGYPNDPVTKKFLLSTIDPVFGFPNIVRFSWSTAEKVLEENAVHVDWEEEEQVKKTPSVKTFFSPEEQKLHRYFKDRCLTSTVTLD